MCLFIVYCYIVYWGQIAIYQLVNLPRGNLPTWLQEANCQLANLGETCQLGGKLPTCQLGCQEANCQLGCKLLFSKRQFTSLSTCKEATCQLTNLPTWVQLAKLGANCYLASCQLAKRQLVNLPTCQLAN